MTRKKILEEYKGLLSSYRSEDEVLAKDIRRFGLYRILFFLLWLILVFISTSWTWIVFGIILFVGMIIFALLVRKHSRDHKRKMVVERLVRINSEEEKAMNWDYSGLEDGSDFSDDKHLFSYDLDLFGKGSLYQYINRTSTTPGSQRLAQLFTGIEKSKYLIRDRQEVVSELSPMLQWRQNFRVQGLMVEEQADDIQGLTDWVGGKTSFQHPFFKILIIFFPLLTGTLFGLTIMNYVSFWEFLSYLIIPLGFAGIKHRRVNIKHNRLSRKYQVLKKYSRLFSLIEKQEFSAQLLKSLQADLNISGIRASTAIHQLARISNAFDTRLNLLAGFLMNIFFLWDIRQSIRLENWQKKNRDHLAGWFRAIAEMDAFISLAGYAYNNPEYNFPEIREEESFQFRANQLGHPLIHVNDRVCNDYNVDTWGNFTILTGANMAGKSTFLRTIGVNMVLTSCGAPVCAGSLSITPVDLVTSIHTIDSLANNESYFYAELKRLKLIIDMLKNGSRVFIILDEILKGTNSGDKQSGSRALIKQLISLKASGIIATHDLSLGELEDNFPGHVQNRCFEIIIEKDKLEYDYLLKPGIAQNMNATILMERMGITVN